MALYRPGTEETDLKKVILALQGAATAVDTLNTATYANSFNARTGAVVPVQGDYPTSLIPGTTTNDSATAGNIGEYISSEIGIGSAVSLTTATAKTITSISLTAGDWDVRGSVGIYPANTTSLTKSLGGLSTVTDSIGSAGGTAVGGLFPATVFDGNTANYASIAPVRYSLGSTTTIYLIGFAAFTVSTCTAFGIISARRVR